jgi:hypothetical protein
VIGEPCLLKDDRTLMCSLHKKSSPFLTKMVKHAGVLPRAVCDYDSISVHSAHKLLDDIGNFELARRLSTLTKRKASAPRVTATTALVSPTIRAPFEIQDLEFQTQF